MNEYNPSLPDLTRLESGAEFTELVERLAEKIHDAWASERIRLGWKHGPERSDSRKEHPSLVPYDQLDEGEKDFDRMTAKVTIAGLLDLGKKL